MNIKEIYSFYLGSLNKYNKDDKIDNQEYISFGTIFYLSLSLIIIFLILSYFLFNEKIPNIYKRITLIIFINIILFFLFLYIYFLVVKKKLYSYSYLDNGTEKKCDKIRLIEPPSINNHKIILIIFSITYVILLTIHVIFSNLSLNFIDYIHHEKSKKNIFSRIIDSDNITYYYNELFIKKNYKKYIIIFIIKHLSLFYIVFKWGINIIFMISYPIIYILHLIITRVILYFIARYIYYNDLNNKKSQQLLSLIFDKNVFFFELTDKIKSGTIPYNKKNELTNSNKKILQDDTNVFSKLPYGVAWTSVLTIIEKIIIFFLIDKKKDKIKKSEITKKTKYVDSNILNFTNINTNNKKFSDFGKDSHVFTFPMSLFVTDSI